MTQSDYIEHTQKWLHSFVIQYNLCPFAKKPFVQEKIRYRLFAQKDWRTLLLSLKEELLFLTETPRTAVETSIIIVPNMLGDFSDYLDFLELANDLIFALRLDGDLQIASFHPDYQFDGNNREDVANYTNRSPFPLFHLLREESVSEAVDQYGDTAVIPLRNIETMKKLGKDFLDKLMF